MIIMSWPVSGAAALLLAALVSGCERSPARQHAGVSHAPLWLPTQIARSTRQPVLVASASAVSDYDHDLSRWKDVPTEPPPTPAVRVSYERPDIDLAPGLSVSSVRYAPSQSSVPPNGVLSITQVALSFDAATDALDALARRLSQQPSAEPQK
jgi:hypothetical protein